MSLTPPKEVVHVAAARSRMPLLWTALALFLADLVLDGRWLKWFALASLVLGLLSYFRLGVLRGQPVLLTLPVLGRWKAVNSPASRVPSHGMTAYGQGQAVDLVYDPQDQSRPSFGWWPLARRARDFPGFGRPVCAPADAVVTHVVDRRRDHWSRNSWPALVYLLLESVREFLGPSQILGNHVVLDCGNGRYAVLAHLRQGSLLVQPGDRLRAGDPVGECGNSGNSTEPHLHVQLMDHPSPLFAAGIPVEFEHIAEDGARSRGMPKSGQTMSTETARAGRR